MQTTADPSTQATMIYTSEARQALTDYLATHVLPKGLGLKGSACSIGAINLALSGELTDAIPFCMSLPLGKFILRLQDAMPHAMRNSERWKSALVLAPGTGREHENERLNLIMNWLWEQVLPQLQPIADKRGFADKWRAMCISRDTESAHYAAKAAAEAAEAAYAAAEAAAAADAANAAYAVADANAAHAAAEAAEAAEAAYAAAEAAADADAANAAYAAAEAAAAADAANAAAEAAAANADAAANAAYAVDFWLKCDPSALLEKLVQPL